MKAPRNGGLQLIAALGMSAGIALSQPKDVDGWGKIKWGMTVAEVKAAYGDQSSESHLEPMPQNVTAQRLVLKNFKVGDIKALVSIETPRRSEVIAQVVVDADVFDARRDDRAEVFAKLKKLLIEKYGSPKTEDRSPGPPQGVEVSAFWSFPSTAITLRWIEPGAPLTFGFVRVEYRPADKKTLDAL